MDFEQYVINSLNEIKAAQEKTLIQTTKTNGRVDALEDFKEKASKDIDKIMETQNQNKGRDKILFVVALVIGTVAGFIIQDFITKHL